MEHGSVYCVDDDEDILRLYEIILGQAGHKVVVLSTGEEALGAIVRRHPDLIILDEKLDDCSGMEICNRIRRNPALPYIPIIMVTGVESKEGKIRSLEEGIDDYILKPFDHEELQAKVMVMLRIKRLYTDLLQTRQNLLQAEKMAAVGQLAAAMAHEIRNPLSIIGASVQFLRNKIGEQEETRNVMDTILRKISEIDGTIRELLAAARPLKLRRGLVDLNQCLQEVVGFIKDKCQVQNVELLQEYDLELPRIDGDEEHLQRVFLNVFINALNSMPQGGSLRIQTRREEGDRAAVTVSDSGAGIQSEDIQHLFEPFFTRQAGGSGLGLFVVKMIIDELQGDIQVRSEPGRGTEFTIRFPRAQEQKLLKVAASLPDTPVIGEGSGQA